MIYTCIQPQGRDVPDNPLWTKCLFNRNSLSLCPFVASLKNISLKSVFLPFFHVCFFKGIQTLTDNPLRTNILWQQKGIFSLPICCKFQNNLFEIWFYTHFLIILYMYIAPRQGQTYPWGQNFDVNRKLLPLRPFVAKKSLWISDFIHIFSCFPCV